MNRTLTTRHYGCKPWELGELLFERSGYTPAQLRELDRIDCAYLHGRIGLEAYLQRLRMARHWRQAQCDVTAALLLAELDI